MSHADWHIPLSRDALTLRQGLDSLAAIGARPQQIPLIVRLLENPGYRLPGMTLFHGAVDLETHDCIHILLGRGLLTADEAFTIGFTMGSTRQVRRVEEWLFGWLTRHVYPAPYTFDDAAVRVFSDAVRLGGLSGCESLDRIDFTRYHDVSLRDIRRRVGLETDLLYAYYRIEQRRHPDAPASRRLLD
jgi:hypothetical protein